jgi:hypothetical protein
VTAEDDQPIPPPDRQTVTVPASRLAWGTYDHTAERESGEGDIHASYSADMIAMRGCIRRLFKWHGKQMVTVGMSGRGAVEQAEAYQLTPQGAFIGTPTTYGQKVALNNGEAARHDPKGFYDSVLVSYKKQAYVLIGPPVLFIVDQNPARPAASAEPEQLNLF